MATLFRCPECKTLHQEPLDAAYVLAVRCAACELEAELARRLLEETELPEAA